MKTTTGNLITLAEQGHFDVIVHGCNCFHTMGAGIAAEIKRRYPAAYSVDVAKSVKGDRSKLGTFTAALVTGPGPLWAEFVIVNAYTQYQYGVPKNNIFVSYNAVTQVFNSIARTYGAYRIGYPKIGAGLAGGKWDKISLIIDKCLDGVDHTLVTLF